MAATVLETRQDARYTRGRLLQEVRPGHDSSPIPEERFLHGFPAFYRLCRWVSLYLMHVGELVM